MCLTRPRPRRMRVGSRTPGALVLDVLSLVPRALVRRAAASGVGVLSVRRTLRLMTTLRALSSVLLTLPSMVPMFAPCGRSCLTCSTRVSSSAVSTNSLHLGPFTRTRPHGPSSGSRYTLPPSLPVRFHLTRSLYLRLSALISCCRTFGLSPRLRGSLLVTLMRLASLPLLALLFASCVAHTATLIRFHLSMALSGTLRAEPPSRVRLLTMSLKPTGLCLSKLLVACKSIDAATSTLM